MTESPVSLRAEAAAKSLSPLLQFFYESTWARRFGTPGICDFTIGNPHDRPDPLFVETLRRWTAPKDCYWFAYKLNEEGPKRVVADSLHKWRGTTFDTEDIFLTNGATGALAVVLSTITDPGDEIIFITPSWFLYESMIANVGGVPVRVRALPETFDLDVAAVEKAITSRTRAVIINSPNNPSGRIYDERTLKHLGEVLTRSSRKNGRPVHLISDEAYARIIYDGQSYPSPYSFYDSTFLVYTYGKTLLTPGQRIGYLALPPSMPGRESLRKALLSQQMLNSWAFPNALMQHALVELDAIPVDVASLQCKRDRMVRALRDMGYHAPYPQGTFYCLVRSPMADDRAFTELLARQDVFCIPGSLQEADGYFRISLTATEEMVERALPVFERVMQETRGLAPPSAPSGLGLPDST